MDASNLAVGSGMHWQLFDCGVAGIGYRFMVSEQQVYIVLAVGSMYWKQP